MTKKHAAQNTKGRMIVTGSGGFLGRALCAHLAHTNAEIIGVGRQSGPPQHLGLSGWVSGDLTDFDWDTVLKSHRPDVVFHLAAISKEPSTPEQERDLFDLNYHATSSLFQAVQKSGTGTRIVFVSSAAIYGPMGENDGPRTETDSWRPSSFYGHSKSAATGLAEVFRNRLNADILSAIPFNVLGPHQSNHQMPQAIIERLRQDPIQLRVGDISAIRDWIDVRDVATGLAAMASRDVPAGLYNIASGKGTSIEELITKVCAAMQTEARVETDQNLISRRGSSVSIGDPTKLMAFCDWKVSYNLDESLKDMINFT